MVNDRRPRHTLLVVDDDEEDRRLLSSQLEARGFTVVVACDAREGLAQVEEGAFDLVLLDITMPGMAALEMLRILRKARSPSQLPIIMATARHESSYIITALRSGANDYVTKPIDFPVLFARIGTHLRLKEATERLNSTLREREEALDRAASVQQALLPPRDIDIPPALFAWHFEPCEALAGDFLNVFPFDATHVGIYMLDVSGHGVQAALLSATLSHLLQPVARSGSIVCDFGKILGRGETRIVPPIEVLERLNERFPPRDKAVSYFTMLYGILDQEDRSFRYATAGHPGFWVLPAAGPARLVQCSSLPIGLFVDGSFEEFRLELQPDDRVFLLSDGVIEARGKNNELFASHRVRALLEEHRGDTLRAAVTSLAKAVRLWSGGTLSDDVSILAFTPG